MNPQNNKFGNQEMLYELSKKCERLLCTNALYSHIYIFFIKKIFIKSKKSKTPCIILVLTKKNLCEKIISPLNLD